MASIIMNVDIDLVLESPRRDTRALVEYPEHFRVALQEAGKKMPLPIHVCKTADDCFYRVLDGHLALEVYKSRKQVEVIFHPEITNETDAASAYVSMNHLRADGWMRNGIKLRNTLVELTGKLQPVELSRLLPDKELVSDLVNRNDPNWAKFGLVTDEKEADEVPEDVDLEQGGLNLDDPFGESSTDVL